ncbi:hypothetical protein [Bradyrhizobium sp. USDA 4451]
MIIPITASIIGHPWDLWGLSLLFDGSDPSKTKVVVTKPEGRPTFDPNSEAERNRFRANGYDIMTSLTSDELVWDDAKGRVDLRDLRPIADDILLRVNGLARTFDPTSTPVRLIHLTFPNGAMATGDWTPNRDSTYLGAAGQHEIANRALPLTNPEVKFVLEAMVLPATWASLYLVIDAIKTNVGGRRELDKMGWLSKPDLSDLTYSANNSRNISEGARHRTKPNVGGNLIPLDIAHIKTCMLVAHWLGSLAPPKSP